MTRHFLILAATSLVALSLFSISLAQDENEQVTLKQAAKGLFEIGVGLGVNAANDPPALELLTREFDFVTPENCMKPAAIQNEQGLCDFRKSDRFMDFAFQHNLKVVGHNLVWAKDDRTPEWFFKNGEELVPRDHLLDRMKGHMLTVMGRYRDKIDQWDVVNEALADGNDIWRESNWQNIFGEPDFIVEAFKIARQNDPEAMLIYNDYRCELPGKRKSLFALIEYLLENEAPVDAIGLQGHYELDIVPYEDLQFTLDKIREYGLKVVISEVDIDVVKRGKWWADNNIHREELKSYDPYADGCPEEINQQLAEQYAKLFEVYARNADIIERVTFWNLHDGQSWLNHFPWERANHPLLFDRECQPKSAHKAVIEVLQRYQKQNK